MYLQHQGKHGNIQKKPNKWIKIYTDGSAVTNLGNLGAGGNLRDKYGKLLTVITTPLTEGTNNKA